MRNKAKNAFKICKYCEIKLDNLLRFCETQ